MSPLAPARRRVTLEACPWIIPMNFALVALATLASMALPPDGVDLSKADRTIKKQPAYRGTPRYALLVFGPKAEHHAWLVVDSASAYVDRNGDGDLTGSGERVELDKAAGDKERFDSGAYSGMNVFDLGEVHGTKLLLWFWVRRGGYTPKDEPEFLKEAYRLRAAHDWENATLWREVRPGGRAQNSLVLTLRPEDAQICHLGGPLTVASKTAWEGAVKRLHRGDPQALLDVYIGTPGRRPAPANPYPCFAPLTIEEVPAGLHPVAVIEYPAKGGKGPPIRQEVVLAKRC
jgi:hypothetical protein